MKKTIPVICSLAIACCVFTGCGDKENDKKDESSKDSVSSVFDDPDSGLESATDASLNSSSAAETQESSQKETDSQGAIDDLVSKGEEIIDEAATAAEDIGEAIMGTEDKGE